MLLCCCVVAVGIDVAVVAVAVVAVAVVAVTVVAVVDPCVDLWPNIQPCK